MSISHIQQTLARFGLSPQEIQLYLAILSLDKPTISQIDRHVDLNRTAIYFHIKQLESKDLVRQVKSSSVKRLRATHPKELATRFEQWSDDFSNVLGELETIASADDSLPDVQVKSLSDSHIDFYNELASLPVASEFRVIQSAVSASKDLSALPDSDWSRVIQKMIARKITTRAIFSEEMMGITKKAQTPETYQLFKKRLWQVRTIPEDRYDFEEMFIYGDKVTFFMTDVSLLLTIHHRRVARALSGVFDALWLSGKPRQWD